MRDKELYAQTWGIKSPRQVADVDLALAKGEVTVRVKLEEGAKLCYPTCGKVIRCSNALADKQSLSGNALSSILLFEQASVLSL
jgi:hypothetical protein